MAGKHAAMRSCNNVSDTSATPSLILKQDAQDGKSRFGPVLYITTIACMVIPTQLPCMGTPLDCLTQLSTQLYHCTHSAFNHTHSTAQPHPLNFPTALNLFPNHTHSTACTYPVPCLCTSMSTSKLHPLTHTIMLTYHILVHLSRCSWVCPQIGPPLAAPS